MILMSISAQAAAPPPITFTELQVTASDAAAVDLFGISVDGAGDLDGDGFDDVIVGAEGDNDVAPGCGSAYVWYGSVDGLDLAREDKLVASDAGTGDSFGRSVAGAGDIDADGYADLVIGAQLSDAGSVNGGAAYVYYGGAAGIDVAREQQLTSSAIAVDDWFGFDVDGAGDVDGDGYDDLIISAYGAGDAGQAYVYYGSASGIDPLREDVLVPLLVPAPADGLFGYSVAGAGDIDGDGYDDVLVGSPLDDDAGGHSGAVHVFFGSATGIDQGREQKLLRSDALSNEWFGVTVAAAGDLDADGWDDLILGSYSQDGSYVNSAAHAFYGSATGVDITRVDAILPLEAGAGAGFGVSGAGDLDADGYADLVVGSLLAEDVGDEAGVAWVYPGGPTGLARARRQMIHAANPSDEDWFGGSVAGAGDVDGSGSSDLVVGAAGYGPWAGAAYLFTTCADSDVDGWCAGVDDCDDADAAVFPGAVEIYGDEVDSDCDGGEVCFVDADVDGYSINATVLSTDADCADAGEASAAAPGGDCVDTDAAVYPGAVETPADGVDSDCDGAELCLSDADGDGFTDGAVIASSDVDCTDEGEADATDPPGDCDDTDAAAYPGAPETVGDGVDSDCDGSDPPAEEEVPPPPEEVPAPLEEVEGCGCGNGTKPAPILLVGALAALLRRRRVLGDR